MNLKGLKINFLGDSITEGHGVSSPENFYPTLLKKDVELAEARNYGIGGTRFAIQKNKVAPIDYLAFTERFSEMDDDADVVVVFGGTNDFGHGDAPIGCFDDRTPDTFYGACHVLFSGLIKKYLGKEIVILTPMHRDFERNEFVPGKGDHPYILEDYVNIIREVAEFYSLPVLDLFRESGLQPAVKEIKEKYMPDGVHPNDEGQKVIAKKLRHFLESL